jgi:hypothetical protein
MLQLIRAFDNLMHIGNGFFNDVFFHASFFIWYILVLVLYIIFNGAFFDDAYWYFQYKLHLVCQLLTRFYPIPTRFDMIRK